MGKKNIAAEEAEKLAKARLDANRKVNLAYLTAGAYYQALEIANKAMDATGLELVYRDKKLVREIQQLSKRLMFLIDELQKGSVLCLPENESMVHEDTIHMFFALFMAIVDRSGLDKHCDLRMYNLYKVICSYKSLVGFNFFDTKETIAFNYVKDHMANNPDITEDSEGNILVKIDGKKTQMLIKK